MKRKEKRVLKQIQAMGKDEQVVFVQAMASEGVNFPAAMHSLLDGSSISSISGITNEYKSYTKQVTETYKKYNGEADFGCAPVRTIVDIRSAFEAGEGMTVVPGEDAPQDFKDFVNDFIVKNKLNATRLFDIAKTTEMSGYCIPFVKANGRLKDVPTVCLMANNKGSNYYFPDLAHSYDLDSVKGIMRKTKDEPERVSVNNFVFIRTGGDGSSCTDLTTRVGIVLTECDAYDKASKEMRELNWKMARITAAFETKNKNETDQVSSWIEKTKWAIGKAFVGTAKLDFKVPGTGAHDNLEKELGSSAKTISGTTSIPVHWLGHTDLMSNRSTAEELYNLINNGTIMERLAIASAMKELIIIAQELYIDAMGGDLKEVYTNFDVNIPIIDFNRFKSLVEAYSKLLADGIISKKTYRGIVPNIDAMKEEEQIAAEEDTTEEDEEIINKTTLAVQDLDEGNIEEIEGE